VITITGIRDHLQPEWLITITGIRNQIAAELMPTVQSGSLNSVFSVAARSQ